MDLHKLYLIFQREYITRIRTKTFIFTTILAPFFMIAIMVVPVLLMLFTSDRDRALYIIDETGIVYERLAEMKPGKYYEADEGSSVAELRTKVMEGGIDGFLFVPDDIFEAGTAPDFFHDGSIGFGVTMDIREDLQIVIRDEKLERAQAGPEIKTIMEYRLSLNSRTLSNTGDEEQDSGILFGIGYFMAFAIYIALFTYGGLVMRGVIEEKTSRVVEVMASCVKPFELLMGKVLGIGAVGLTQFIIWIVAGAALMTLAVPIISLTGEIAVSPDIGLGTAEADLPFTIPSIGFSIWIGFVLFFLLGYLIYSSIFAAIGSAVDSETDTQQLMIPVIFIIMIPILILGKVANDPTSSFAVITSMIPFFAPILMPVRLAIIDLPLWQLSGSICLMLLTFILIIWLSARIYRVGILMYGKKAGMREMVRWIKYS